MKHRLLLILLTFISASVFGQAWQDGANGVQFRYVGGFREVRQLIKSPQPPFAITDSLGKSLSFIAYIDTAGDDSKAKIGDIKRPFKTIDAAMDALPLDKYAYIKIGVGTFNAPSPSKIRSNITYEGYGKPITNSVITITSQSSQPTTTPPTKLVGGTIINGTMQHINKKNVKIKNLGVDVGSDWCDNFNGGDPADGINFAQYYNPEGGQSSSDGTHSLQTDSAPSSGVEIRDVSVLIKNSTAPVHAILMENLINPIADNISTYFGAYGFVSKSFGGNFSNVNANGHGSAGILLKSNDYAYTINTNLVNAYVTSILPFDGEGIGFQGEEGTVASLLNLSNINVSFTKNGLFNTAAVTGLNINGANLFNIQNNGVDFNGAVSYTFLDGVQARLIGNIGFKYNMTGESIYNTITNSLASDGVKGFDLTAGTDNVLKVQNLQSINNDNAFTLGTNIYGTGLHYILGTFIGSITSETVSGSDGIALINSDGNIGKSSVTLSQLALEANVVHNTGTETINGDKTFTSDVQVSRATGNPSFILQNGSGGSFPLHQMIDNRVGGKTWNIENGRTLGNFELLAGGIGTVFSLSPTGDLSFTGKGTAGAAPTVANDLLRYTDLGTGFAQYTDNALTSGSPLVVNSGVTSTITNNAATSITGQLPIGVTSFYNSGTSKITPQNDGDSYLINVRFTAVSNNNAGLADVSIDIGGAMNIIAQQTVALSKGAGQAQKVNIIFDVFSGSTFLANGGLIKLNSVVGNTSVYDVSYKVTRTHKAK